MNPFRFWALTALQAPLVPVYAIQGKYTRQVTPVLPDAPGEHAGTFPGEPPALRVLALGDSVIACAGLDHPSEGLAGQTARHLNIMTGRETQWRGMGISGAKSTDILREIVPQIDGEWDALLLVCGMNDMIALRSPERFRRDLVTLLKAIREKVGSGPPIAIAEMPPVARFPSLPEPLRSAMAFRARAFDDIIRAIVDNHPRLAYGPLPGTLKDVTPETFAPDGFHPGPVACDPWGAETAAVIAPLLQ